MPLSIAFVYIRRSGFFFMQPLSVLVVDDHSIVRQGICGIVSDEPTLEIVGEVASGEEVVTRAQSLRPDLVLLDISLPEISGIAAARLIRKVSSQSRIIFLSQHDSPQMVREAFSAIFFAPDPGTSLAIMINL